MSRRVYLLGLALALVALALAFTDWALGMRPGVTEANVRRIRPGMTLREVEGILGSPGRALPPIRGSVTYAWSGRAGEVWISMDWLSGKRPVPVKHVLWWPLRRPELGPLARLRAWLGW